MRTEENINKDPERGERGPGERQEQTDAARASQASTPQLADIDKLTPMMAQYTEIKCANPNYLLFYRMGDFYELFFDDAIIAAGALSITLTKRGKFQDKDIPMCGVPVHAANDYLQRLIRAGFRVAVCEQTEDPAEAKKRGAKAVVRRDVVRLVTPGTLTEDSLLDARQHNYLTALHLIPAPSSEAAPKPNGSEGHNSLATRSFALASIDISTGSFMLASVAGSDLLGELARIAPSEILLPDRLEEMAQLQELLAGFDVPQSPVPSAHYDSMAGTRALKARLGVSTLEGYGDFSRQELAAAGAALTYIELTQLGRMPALLSPERGGAETAMVIDAATRTNLELTRSSRGEKKGSLLHAIDRTVTGAGARLLGARIASPLRDKKQIDMRLDAVSELVERAPLREELRFMLKACPDLARALSRVLLERASPRDLGAVREGLYMAQQLARALGAQDALLGGSAELHDILNVLNSADISLHDHLTAALIEDDLPANKRDGGFVRRYYHDGLDEHRVLRDESRKFIAALQARYSEETGVKSLKLKHNNVLGYFVEVTANNSEALRIPPHDTLFIHRQTMANAMRFTTAELGELEAKIIQAGERSQAIEIEIFDNLCAQVKAAEKSLSALADGFARLDLYAALAELAEQENYCRPKIYLDPVFDIRAGRHPVVEQALAKEKEGSFIENECCLVPSGGEQGDRDEKGGAGSADRNGAHKKQDKTLAQDIQTNGKLWVVTGPNMAGKSTFLRQNALITILAQMGCFVPASEAHIGVVDRLFSRVGASDDLARGRSTFMVEMVETAGILNQASAHSLVILDEIGRGTATFDGLSIAWATVEYLHDTVQCRALFATHYHELTALAGQLDHAMNATIAVKDWRDKIVFLHKVVPGAADRSYGIQVAKLAGLPKPVIKRASAVLKLLERNERQTKAPDLLEDLPLFSAPVQQQNIQAQDIAPDNPLHSAGAEHSGAQKAEPSPIIEMLQEINPDTLNAKQALDLVYQLKQLMQDAD